jgi:GLPGLI family protein
MKRLFFFSAACLLSILSASAQQSDMAQVLVHYKFTHIRDTSDPQHPYTENMVLIVGKTASVYKSYDGMLAIARFRKAYEEALKNSPDGRVMVNRIGAGSSTEYYQYPNEKKLKTKDRLMINSYLVEEAEPNIEWKITADTASFSGMHCQKATCHFKGRDYIAWFCPDLPIRTGPWKLNGLPGVILDAHDIRNEVVFKFDGMEKAIPIPASDQAAATERSPILEGVYDDPNLIEPPSNAIKATPAEFNKLKETMEKAPEAFAQAIMGGQNNVPGNGPKMDGIRVKAGPARIINNPIELPEPR